ncbi:MAG TPA: PAS domain-containing protein [Candidatus Limnocylindria bacterium]|nr:PAS domain-containing protein [Candidatus Limnocylindria bacterium]
MVEVTGRGDLTPRQRELVELVSRGLATKQIAARLRVSERAITARLTRLYQRFGVGNRAGLIARVLASEPGDDERFRAYRSAPFMAAVTRGPEHRYVSVNEVAARVAGRNASDLVGRTLREIYPDLQPEFEQALDDVYRTGRSRAMADAPARFPGADGSYRDTKLNLIFQPLRDTAGTVVGILHIGTETPD